MATTSVAIIQPPLAQLNGPYPSGAYLSAFFRGLPGVSAVRWIDAGNLLFDEIFSREGLSRLLTLSGDAALSLAASQKADEPGTETAFQLRRFVSSGERWVSWIDGIVSILRGGSRELSHAFVRSPHAPRGARMDSFLAGLEAEPSADDARMLATLALEDIADYIAVAYDSEFSLVRYAESITTSERSFARIEAAIDRPTMRDFYAPALERMWASLDASPVGRADRVLFCLSVPFPGCLVGALATARSIRASYGERATITMGGGYVNTELRNLADGPLFAYVDALSLDRGYGGYASLLSVDPSLDPSAESPAAGMPAAGMPARDSSAAPGSVGLRVVSSDAGGKRVLECPREYLAFERRVTESLVPDYSDVDFLRYPRLADDPNPMHRLWSDGAWIKAYLAHGCYWHRCSFCDVSLDYIASYRPVRVRRLYEGLRRQALDKGVPGIHLVDEAAPPRALRDFALANIEACRTQVSAGRPQASAGRPQASACRTEDRAGIIPFWGNIRFEKSFDRDLADFLCAGGLVAVSGGIEIASPEGFKSVDKGIDLENLVGVCAAFKEAGVLVHAYLIYGYWDEDAQGVIDSAETMRQLFSLGLVDSAFWHKFVLTRHSRAYGEYRAGLRKGLEPIEIPGDFADNDLGFKGEEESSRYTAPLDAALQAWMAGEGFDKPVRKWFPFPMPAPRIGSDVIERYVEAYEARRDAERNKAFDPAIRYFWAGTKPLAVADGLVWWHLGEEVRFPAEGALRELVASAVSGDECDGASLSRLPRAAFKALRRHGLLRIGPSAVTALS